MEEGGYVSRFFQDLRYGLRVLRKNGGFTLVVALTLAVGIGSVTAIFALVNAALLRPLPFKEPDGLMAVWLTMPGMYGRPARDSVVWSYPKYQTFRELQDVFDDASVYRGTTFTLTAVDEPERVPGEWVDEGYFTILGVDAVVGRTFLPEENQASGETSVAVLGNGLWERRFGGDPDILGRRVEIDTESYTVVGVLPRGFHGLTGRAEIWLPTASVGATALAGRWSHSYHVIARRRPGVSAQQARSSVVVLGRRIDEAHPDPSGPYHWGASAQPLAETRVNPTIRRSILVFFGAVAFVLLIACVNIANLLLARGGARRREIAIRYAVGASRPRIVCQVLSESLLLAFAGAIPGLLFAFSCIEILNAVSPEAGGLFGQGVSGLLHMSLSSIAVDSTVLLFALCGTLLTGAVFGLAPALDASGQRSIDEMKGVARARVRIVGRSALVVGELALAMVLLVGSGLMIRSLGRLLATPTGIDPEQVLTMRIQLPYERYDTAQAMAFFEELEARIRALPGVRAAGLGSCLPVSDGCSETVIWFRDRPPVPEGSEPLAGVRWASPSYFEAMKIPRLRGRMFQAGDRTGLPKVVLINETAAAKYWPDTDPIGKPIAVDMGGFDDRAEIIGIVGDVRYGSMDEAPGPDVYIPFRQSPQRSLAVFVRTATDTTDVVAAVRREVGALDKTLPVYAVGSMHDQIAQATRRIRFSTTLLTLFALIAISLAALGVHGVMAHTVSQRTREVGLRMALGAEAKDVVWLVLRDGIVITALGVGIGILGGLASTKVLTALLYEVSPTDFGTYLLLAGILGGVALLASTIPAHRATKVDPTVSLRYE